MDQAYEPYFTNRVALVRGIGSKISPALVDWNIEFNVQEMVSNALTSAQQMAESNGTVLRGDAQLLLLLAFQELVARPVTTVRADFTAGLPQAISADMQTITQSAVERNGNREISAHAIVDATSQLWPQLHTAQFNVWDG